MNNRMYGMFSWINVRLEEGDLSRTSGLLPQLCVDVMSDTMKKKKMNDMLIKCSGVTKLEERVKRPRTEYEFREMLRDWNSGSKSRRET